GESLCAECDAHFAEVRRYLDAYGVAYVLEPTLVRGLDYYTRTVFEFVGPAEKAQSAICSGGRYDGLVEVIGGPATPGIGVGAGALRAEPEGRELTLAGWVATRRDHGGLVFVDLRDEGGLLQVVINPENAPEAAASAHALRNEFVVRVHGKVVRRSPETVNPG